MNEIIKVDFENQTVSARELHEKLNIEKRFSAWFETNSQGFVRGEDFTSVLSGTVVNNGAHRELQDYQLTVDMAKHICLMSRTEIGKTIRQYFIDLEKAWNTPEQVMARALKLADKTIQGLQLQVEEMKPKALFADAVTVADTAILVRELAKLMKQNGIDIGEKRLYKRLREEGYICKGKTEPTQKAMEMGLFEVQIRTIQGGADMPVRETRTTYVTGKGQVYFINRYLKDKEKKGKEVEQS